MSWDCPICNRNFKKINQQHSCVDKNIFEHIHKLKPELIPVFEKLHSFLMNFDNLKVSSVKTFILYSSKSIFLSLKTKREYFEIEFFANKTINEFPVFKTLQISKNRIVHSVKLDSVENIDEQLLKWITESYELVNN